MEIKWRKSASWIMGLTIILLLLVVNFLSAKFYTRVDLTDKQQYTLSKATKNLLTHLEDIVTVRVYFSKEMPPALQTIQTDVNDLLAEFKIHSKNNIRIEYHNPQSDPMTEQKVMLMGIPPLDVNVIKKDKQEIAKIYLGMSIHFTDKQEVLAVVQDSRNLEYRLAAGILKVTQKETPVIGWCDPSHTVSDDPYLYIQDRIKERYDIRKLYLSDLAQLKAQHLAALVFFSPPTLTKPETQAVENYLKDGGKLLLMAEEVALDLQKDLTPKDVANPLATILKTYGVTVENNLVLDRSNASATFSMGYASLFTPYPYWVLIRPESFNREEPMVSELNTLILPWSSSIAIDKTLPEKTTVASLYETTEFGVAQNFSENLNLDPNGAKESLNQTSTRKYPLGVLITRQNAEKKPDTKILLVGNQQFLQDHFLQRYRENSIFFENAVDVFASGDTLIGIRTKASSFNPISLAEDRSKAAVKYLNLFLSPTLLIGFGLITWVRRKSRAQHLQELFGQHEKK